jgi:cell division protein FtsB
MTSPSSRRPRRTSRPDRASVSRGRRSRVDPSAGGPGRRARTPAGSSETGAVAARGGWIGSRVARQITVLGLVLGVVALSLMYPLRNYAAQREQLAAAVESQQQLNQRIAELKIEQAALADPNFIAAEARRRLQYVRPGDTVYVVQAPGLAVDEQAPGAAPTTPGGPWYRTLWDTMSHPPGTAVDPEVLAPVVVSGTPTTGATDASTGPTG